MGFFDILKFWQYPGHIKKGAISAKTAFSNRRRRKRVLKELKFLDHLEKVTFEDIDRENKLKKIVQDMKKMLNDINLDSAKDTPENWESLERNAHEFWDTFKDKRIFDRAERIEFKKFKGKLKKILQKRAK